MSIQADNWAREEHAAAIAERRGCYHCLGLAYGIEAAKKAGQVVGFPPDLSGNFMILNGTRFPVINAWPETEASDGRKRWGIVTEAEEPAQSGWSLRGSAEFCGALLGPYTICAKPPGHEGGHPTAEEQPATPADATALPIQQREGYGIAPKAEWNLGPADATAEDEGEPLIKPLTEFDLHMLARYRGPSDVQPQGQYIERPSGPPVRVDGPGCTPATVREFRPCDDCTTPFTCEEGGEDRCP